MWLSSNLPVSAHRLPVVFCTAFVMLASTTTLAPRIDPATSGRYEQQVLFRTPASAQGADEGEDGRSRVLSQPSARPERRSWHLQRVELQREIDRVLAIGTSLTNAAVHTAVVRNAPMKQLKAYRQQPIEEKPRLGICIVGQRARLELSSKLRHVLRPLRLHYNMDVVLSLSPSKHAIFVNNGSDAGGQRLWTEYTIFRRIRNALEANDNTNGAVIVDSTAQEPFPMVHYAYVIAGDKYDSLFLKEERARAHVRQWASLWRCYAHFVELEEANGEPYTVFIKLRDDSLVLAPILGMINTSFSKDVAVFKQCNAHGGLNDKVAILDAQFGYAFFGAPLIDWYFNFQHVLHAKAKLRNPEAYLWAIMTMHNVTVKLVAADQLPVITSRAYGATRVATCVPLLRGKIGDYASCVSTNCEIRRRVYCQHCSGVDRTYSAEWSEDEAKRHLLQGCVSKSQLRSWECGSSVRGTPRARRHWNTPI